MTTAQGISAFGDAFASVAMPLLVLQISGQVALMGLTVSLSVIGRLVTGVVAGGVVDRFDRRQLVVVTEAADFVLAGSIPVAWLLLPEDQWLAVAMIQILVVVTLSSVVSTIHDVALRTLMPTLAGRDRLLVVNARVTTVTEITYGVGPAVAGVVVALAGAQLAIGVNAVTFAISAGLFCMLRLPHAGRAVAVTAKGGNRGVGLRYVWSHPFLRPLLVMELVNTLLVAGVVTLFIYYLRVGIGEGPISVGLVLSLASVGALAASLCVAPARKRFGYGRVWLGGVALEGAALCFVALHQSLTALAVLAVVFAMGNVTCAIVGSTVRQLATPDPILGRVTAATMTVLLSAEAVGVLGVTISAQLLPVVAIFVAVGAACICWAAVGLFTAVGRTDPSQDANLGVFPRTPEGVTGGSL
ncbi:MAG TPA: MFS transporter [Jiangellaceae bacterium]